MIIIGTVIVTVLWILILKLNGMIESDEIVRNYFIPIIISIGLLVSIISHIMTKRKIVGLIIDKEGIHHPKKGSFKWQEIVLIIYKREYYFAFESSSLLLNLVYDFETIEIKTHYLNEAKISKAISFYRNKYESTRHNKG